MPRFYEFTQTDSNDLLILTRLHQEVDTVDIVGKYKLPAVCRSMFVYTMDLCSSESICCHSVADL